MPITAREVWRDFVTEGIPASGAHKPRKTDVRAWGGWLENMLNALSAAGGKLYTSLASLNADLSSDANTPALVIGDAVAGNNGLYMKVGASGSGSWQRVGDVPGYQFVRADYAGGTANAIEATSNLPISEETLVWLPVEVANTGSPVTVSFNGGVPLTVKTNSGNDVAPGGIASGMILLGAISGASFRLVSDQVSAAVLAAAEAAADRAQGDADRSEVAREGAETARDIAAGYASDAVSQGNVPIYATIDGMPALEVPVGINAIRVNGRHAVGDGLGGLFIDADNGSADTFESADGRTWYWSQPIWRQPKSEEWLLSSDWHVNSTEFPDTPAIWQNFLHDIAHKFPRIDMALMPGDFVQVATQADGSPYPYGFEVMKADVQDRLGIRWDRFFFTEGNHDQNIQTYVADNAFSYSYEEARKWMGRECWYVTRGNLLLINLPDMGGTGGGEVSDYVLTWFSRVNRAHPGYNIIWLLHQPIAGTAYTTAPSGNTQYQSAALISLLGLLDNVVAVLYGHLHENVGGGVFGDVTRHETAWGTEHINVAQGATKGTPIDAIYNIAHVESGSRDFKITRHNATTGEALGSEYDIDLQFKYPLELSPDIQHDGRWQSDGRFDPYLGHLDIVRNLDGLREFNGTNWVVPPQILEVLNLIVEDRSVDTPGIGFGTSMAFSVPGSTAIVVTPGETPTRMSPGYKKAAWLGAERLSSSSASYRSKFFMELLNGSGGVERVLEAFTSENNQGGIQTPGSVFAGAGKVQINPSVSEAISGVQLNRAGYLAISRAGNGMNVQRQSSAGEGQLAAWYYGTTQVGGISVTAGGTNYNVVSDAGMKDSTGELSPEAAKAILDLITIHEFRWKSTGERGVGVFAQELYEVYPDAVTPGGWFLHDHSNPDTPEIACNEGTAGSAYRPWAVDYSKLMPVVIRCVQKVMERQDEMGKRLSALEDEGLR